MSPHPLDMPTILHLIDTKGPGGAETVFLDLFDAFDRDGFRSVALVGEGGWAARRLRAESTRVHRVDGRLTAAGSGEGIAAAVRDLAADPDERRRLGTPARETVARRFSLDAMVRACRDVFQEALRA